MALLTMQSRKGDTQINFFYFYMYINVKLYEIKFKKYILVVNFNNKIIIIY